MARQCTWFCKMARGDALPPAPPPRPLSQTLEAGDACENYPQQDATYTVFPTKADDKHSQCRHALEVNAIGPPVP